VEILASKKFGVLAPENVGVLAPENVGVILIWRMAICAAYIFI